MPLVVVTSQSPQRWDEYTLVTLSVSLNNETGNQTMTHDDVLMPSYLFRLFGEARCRAGGEEVVSAPTRAPYGRLTGGAAPGDHLIKVYVLMIDNLWTFCLP